MAEVPRTLVVGDVHGCAAELDDLLRDVGYGSGDQLVFVGDLVAKGPDSRGVVARVRELGARVALGNHEAHCLRWESARRAGEPLPKVAETHRSACESLSAAELDWLFALPHYVELPDLGAIVVHAGLVPGVPLAKQSPEDMLNMRSIRPDGTASKKIADGVPWVTRWPGPELVIFGHDAMRGLQITPHAIGIDTGCVYGGELTAIELPTRRRYSVEAHRAWSPID